MQRAAGGQRAIERATRYLAGRLAQFVERAGEATNQEYRTERGHQQVSAQYVPDAGTGVLGSLEYRAFVEAKTQNFGISADGQRFRQIVNLVAARMDGEVVAAVDQPFVLEGAAHGFRFAFELRIDGMARQHNAVQHVLSFGGAHLGAVALEFVTDEIGIRADFIDEDAAFAIFDDTEKT